ncbi:ribonuclease H-like domain-containing protein [Microseira sp. BLCC-F43]|jgi:ribonuclease D|uniref:ribonuclease H-like domain-containing protein n=1 Tax=Microseira sp. BLCC-F43 TaxID=3153602 RepID=UPI0035B913E4
MESKEFQVGDRDLSEQALSQYLENEAVAVDTEAMGLIPVRDRLCLVQLCNEKDQVTVIRIAQGQSEAPNLKRLLEDPKIIKVFHFARFDVKTISHHLGIQVTPIFCTKIASKLARTYSANHSLKDLVKELEGVELNKTAQISDWGSATDLSEEQLSYAVNDVRYLLSLRQKLTTMLKRENRWELAQKSLQCLPTIVEQDLLQYKDVFEY